MEAVAPQVSSPGSKKIVYMRDSPASSNFDSSRLLSCPCPRFHLSWGPSRFPVSSFSLVRPGSILFYLVVSEFLAVMEARQTLTLYSIYGKSKADSNSNSKKEKLTNIIEKKVSLVGPRRKYHRC